MESEAYIDDGSCTYLESEFIEGPENSIFMILKFIPITTVIVKHRMEDNGGKIIKGQEVILYLLSGIFLTQQKFY